MSIVAPQPANVRENILRVAGLSVLLALASELLLVLVAAGTGESRQALVFGVDLFQKLPWSLLICIGLPLGLAASRQRPAVMVGVGLILAPAASLAAAALLDAAPCSC